MLWSVENDKNQTSHLQGATKVSLRWRRYQCPNAPLVELFQWAGDLLKGVSCLHLCTDGMGLSTLPPQEKAVRKIKSIGNV